MATITIGLDLTVKVEDGPQIAFSNIKKMEGYGALDIEVPAKGATKVDLVELQPSQAAKVKFLLIKPKVSPVKVLNYTVTDGTEVVAKSDPTKKIDHETDPFALKEAHLYSEGMMTFITNNEAKDQSKNRVKIDPKVLKFSNSSDKSIAIEILVGRDPGTS